MAPYRHGGAGKAASLGPSHDSDDGQQVTERPEARGQNDSDSDASAADDL